MSSHNASPVATAIPGYLAGTWKAGPEHSRVAFSVRQLGLKVPGRFTAFDLTIVTGEDPPDSSVSAVIDLGSLDTGNAKRDAHIRSDTFLDVAAHPTATYDSTGIRPAGAGWVVDGDLTLHGVTRSVPLAVAVTGFGPGPGGGRRAAFSATARIKRGAFGIDRWTGGGLVVSDHVAISLEIHAVQQ